MCVLCCVVVHLFSTSVVFFFFFKQKTAYEMRISDWSSDVCSSDLPGQVIGRDIGDGRIVIYRGEDGAVRAMSAYCKHMGADLSVGGEVVGNNIRCPFHHWAYGDGGQCRHIPAGDEIPKRATLFHFASAEQFGLIWVFFGKKPLYELQTFEDFDEAKHVARSYQEIGRANV